METSFPMELFRRFEAAARERLGEAVYDYYAGGAGEEQTVAENAAAWRRVWLRPRGLVDVATVDTATVVLGHHLAAPVILAPVATHALLHPEGEAAAARAARAAGSLFCLSTRTTADVADVAAAADGPWWLQLYVQRDRKVSEQALAEAREHGCTRVILTVDLPVAGRRERELRHGELPLPAGGTKPPAGFGVDASLTWADLGWIREAAGVPVLVKGVLSAADALAAAEHGAEAVVVSNHGGRQLDGCVPTAVALREVVAALDGRLPVLVDGGLRDGGDIVRALALGASAVLVGRPYAWGLAAAGEEGVCAVLDALREDLALALALCGCPTVAAVTPDHVRLAGW